MKNIKSLLLIVLLLIVGRTYADNLVVPDISLAAGETKTLEIELVNTEKQYTGFQFDLVLPVGVSIAKDEYNDLDAVLSRSPKNKHTFEVSSVGSNTYRFLAFNTSNIEFSGQSGTIVSVSVVAATDATGGAQTATVKDIVLTAADASELKPIDINFTITLPEPAITITARSYSRAYGEANPTFEYDVTGGTLTGTPILTCEAIATSDVGEYDIVVAQGSVTNTNVTFENGTLTITKATPTVTAPTAIEGTLTYSGSAQNLVNAGSTTGGEIQYALSAGGTYSTTIPQGTNAGDYTIYYKVVGGTNYEDVAEAGPVNKMITQKTLTITADAKSKVYGEADPSLTYTSEGLVEGDAITGALAREAGNDVGEYDITQGTLTAGNNYTIAFTGAKLTITAAALTGITVSGYEGTYDGATHMINVTAPEGATVKYGITEGTYDLDAAPSYTNAGNYTTYYQVTKANYNAVVGSQTVAIAKRPLTITAEAKEKVYGAEDPVLTYTSEGLVEGDAITGALAREAGNDVGEYNITQGTLTAGDNYTISFTGAKLTITAAALAGVTASGYEDTYDGAAHKISVTAPEGATVKYGATEGTYDLNAAPSYTNAGNYTTYYQVTKANYSAVAGSQTVSIASKALAVTADAKTKVYGEADPILTYTSVGLVGTDAITGALTRTAGNNVGEYDITQGTLSAGTNYTINYTGAKLTVSQLEAALSWSNTGFTYNGQEQKPTATVSNLIGTDVCTVTVSGATDAGNHTSTASALSNANYKLPEAKTQSFTINPAPLTISVGTYKMQKGEDLPAFQAEYDGFVNGETENVLTTKPTFTTTATSSSNRGDYVVSVSGAVAANYDIAYQNGTLIVTEVVVNEGGTTIEEGEDGYYVVTVDEEGGGSSEGGVISDTQLDNEGKIEVAELTYTRELDAPSGGTADATIEGSDAKLYTTCLPDVPTIAANAKYYTLDAANSTTLTFVEVANSNLAANTPYLVAVTSGSDLDESQNVTNVTLKKEADNSTEKDGFVFKGTLTGLTNAEAAAAGAYILQSGNVWGKVTTAKPTAYIPAFRAYIVSTSANAPEMLNGNLGDGTTNIQNIRTVDLNGTECWYDLNGKRIQKPTKGINIKNGRKVVIK